MKIDKNLYIKHAKRLHLVLNKLYFIDLINKEGFNKLLCDSLIALSILEKQFTNANIAQEYSSKILVEKFNKISKKAFNINKIDLHKYSNNDLLSIINYLPIYCKNIFKIDIDNFHLNHLKNTRVNNNLNSINKNNYFSQFNVSNHLAISNAYNKLKNDILSGKIYIYKTKPKSLIIIKWIFLIMMFLTCISLITMFALSIPLYKLKINVDGSEQNFGSMSIMSGIWYILLFTFFISITIKIMSSLISKNNNLKFSFQWIVYFFLVAITILSIISELKSTWFLDVNNNNDVLLMKLYNAWCIIYVILLAMLFIDLILIILGWLHHPKKDMSLIDSKLCEYANENDQQPIKTSVDDKNN